MTTQDGPLHYDVTRVRLIDALGEMPLGEYLTLEARAKFADRLLAQMPEASPPNPPGGAEVPAEAITAAARVLAHFVSGTEREPFPEPDAEDITWAAESLKAATPHVLAAAGKVISEGQAREIMQATVEAQKPRLLAEVAAATDERLQESMARVVAAERGRLADLIEAGASRVGDYAQSTEGNRWTQFTAAEAIRGAWLSAAALIREQP